jgi:dolichyl-phosphate-mannose--protein O-mannosyl transferase
MLRAVVGDGLAIAVAALAVYAFGWWLHFALLGEPGPGDRWGAPTGHWIADTIAVQRRMWGANTGLAAQHGYGSAWWSWPLMLRAVSYWSTGGASLALVGNPVVWWGSSVGLVVVLVSAPLRALTKPAAGDPARAWPPGLWLLVCGWALCYFPLAGVRRVLFLYHYLSALVFAVCAVALWLDHSGWLTRPGDWRVQPRVLWFLVAALVGGFALLAPFTLAYVHAPAYQEAVFGMLPGWR